MLTTNTKIKVYQAYILRIMLYSSESWTLYSRQERKLNAFHMRCLRKILGIVRQDHVTSKDVLAKANISTMFGLPSLRRLRLLDHVRAVYRVNCLCHEKTPRQASGRSTLSDVLYWPVVVFMAVNKNRAIDVL